MLKKRNKLFAILTAAVMLVGLLPMNVLAATPHPTTATSITAAYWNGTESKPITFRSVDISDATGATKAIDTTIIDYTIPIAFGEEITIGALGTSAATATASLYFAASGVVSTAGGLYRLTSSTGSTTQLLGDQNASLIGAGNVVDGTTKAKLGDVFILFNGDAGTTGGSGAATFEYATFKFVSPDGSTITGNGSVNNPILIVNIPSTIVYAIDPLVVGTEAGTTWADNTQITGSTFPIVNDSSVPVRVDVSLTFAGDAITNLQDGATFVPADTQQAAVKKFSIGAVAATDTVLTGATFGTPMNGTSRTYSQATANTIRWANASTKQASIGFVLDKGDGNAQDEAFTINNVAFMSLYGRLETYPAAKWTSSDITLASGSYTITGIKQTDYKEAFIANASSTGADPATKTGATVASYAAWNGGLKGTNDRIDAIQMVGLNVYPMTTVADGSADHPYVLTSGRRQIVEVTSLTAANLNFILSGTSATQASDISGQIVRPDFSVVTMPATDANLDGWEFTPATKGLKLTYKGFAFNSADELQGYTVRTVNMITSTETYVIEVHVKPAAVVTP